MIDDKDAGLLDFFMEEADGVGSGLSVLLEYVHPNNSDNPAVDKEHYVVRLSGKEVSHFDSAFAAAAFVQGYLLGNKP